MNSKKKKNLSSSERFLCPNGSKNAVMFQTSDCIQS